MLTSGCVIINYRFSFGLRHRGITTSVANRPKTYSRLQPTQTSLRVGRNCGREWWSVPQLRGHLFRLSLEEEHVAQSQARPPGTCKATRSLKLRVDSLNTNFEKPFVFASLMTSCIHAMNVWPQFSLYSSTIFASQAFLNHVKSFLCPGESAAPRRARRSSTSKRSFLAGAPPAFTWPCPKLSAVKVPQTVLALRGSGGIRAGKR